MLSYQHAYHAGNFADVLKHLILVEILEHLLKKDKAVSYYETHAGSGLYDFSSVESKKREEFNEGIARLSIDDWPELTRYFDIIKKCNQRRGSSTLRYYPGSPMFALEILRSGDRAWLFELHPQESVQLKENIGSDARVKLYKEDGHAGLFRLLPPQSRRGFVMVDPAFEVKTEYDQAVETLLKAYKKFPTGVYALWYPVVDRSRVQKLEQKFITSGIRNIQRFELGVTADTTASGMTVSGMIIINPPWQLLSKMTDLLPRLALALARDDQSSDKKNACWKVDCLVAE